MHLFKKKSELGLYIMEKFMVDPSSLKIKTTKYKMRLMFTNRTLIEKINDLIFGMNIFNQQPFKHLIDQIGVD